jgi:hypothetical protein
MSNQIIFHKEIVTMDKKRWILPVAVGVALFALAMVVRSSHAVTGGTVGGS